MPFLGSSGRLILRTPIQTGSALKVATPLPLAQTGGKEEISPKSPFDPQFAQSFTALPACGELPEFVCGFTVYTPNRPEYKSFRDHIQKVEGAQGIWLATLATAYRVGLRVFRRLLVRYPEQGLAHHICTEYLRIVSWTFHTSFKLSHRH